MVVYKTTNLVNGKSYIGKDKHNNPNYLGSGKRLHSAIKKYGKENFKKEILEYCNTYDELRDKEVFWIKKFDAATSTKFYNIAEENYGVGNFKGFTKSDWDNFSNKMSKISTEKWKCSTSKEKLKKSITNFHKNMSAATKLKRSEKISKNWKENKDSRINAIREGIRNSEIYKNRDLSNSGRKPKVIITNDIKLVVISMYTDNIIRSEICKVTELSKWQVNTILKKVGLIK
jgi:group I intron endonuclease